MNAVEIKNLQFAWQTGQSNLLDIPQLHLPENENLFIHGSSGTGKSTLLNLLAGVTSVQSGDIQLLGHSICTMSQAKRDRFRAKHMGYIFQQFNLLPYLSVLQNVLLPLKFSKERKLKALQSHHSIEQAGQHWLGELNLPDNLFHAPVTQLSVGQQQRVAAARALIGSPEIIIADEPTSSLDQDNVDNFMETLLQESLKINASVIFVSHDKNLASYFEHHHYLGQGVDS